MYFYDWLKKFYIDKYKFLFKKTLIKKQQFSRIYFPYPTDIFHREVHSVPNLRWAGDILLHCKKEKKPQKLGLPTIDNRSTVPYILKCCSLQGKNRTIFSFFRSNLSCRWRSSSLYINPLIWLKIPLAPKEDGKMVKRKKKPFKQISKWNTLIVSIYKNICNCYLKGQNRNFVICTLNGHLMKTISKSKLEESKPY